MGRRSLQPLRASTLRTALAITPVLLGFAHAAAAAPARSDTLACTKAADRAQTSMAAKHYLSARDDLNVCSASSCPAVVQHDCAGWLTQVNQALPSVVVRVTDATGADDPAATITVADRKVAQGVGVDFDPGTYSFEARDGDAHVASTVVIAEAEHSRVLVLHLPAPTPKTDPTTANVDAGRPSWPWPWIAGGVAIAGFATFGVLQLTSQSKYDDLKDSCAAPAHAGCTSDQVSPVRTQVIGSAIGLGVGVVGLAAAVTLFVLRPDGAPAQTSARGLTPTASGFAYTF